MITRSVEPGDGIIQVVSIGTATEAEIDAHYDALRELIAARRAAGGKVRVLSDQTGADRLPDELNHHIKAQIERTYEPEDRVALLMATDEDKAYARGVLGVAHTAVFNSRLAAEMWLMETDQKPPA